MPKKIYDKHAISVAAAGENATLVFTSTDEVPRKLLGVSSNDVTALTDIIIYDDREKIADIPADVKALTQDWIHFDRDIKPGNQLKIGIRNGSGGTIAPEFSVLSEIPDEV